MSTPLPLDEALDHQFCIPNKEADATFYWDPAKLTAIPNVVAYLKRMADVQSEITSKLKLLTNAASLEDSMHIALNGKQHGAGRTNLCLAYRGRLLSVTIRDFERLPYTVPTETISLDWQGAPHFVNSVVQAASIAEFVLNQLKYRLAA